MKRYMHRMTAALALCLCASAWSPWSAQARDNTPLADVPNAAQVQPQIAAAADGNVAISWFSQTQSAPLQGYDVRLQRLNAQGGPLWSPQGVEVARLGIGWTERHGLAVDAQGNAWLAFQDDRSHPPTRRITVAKIGPGGDAPWGAAGVAPGLAADEQHAPHIALLPDGQAIVGWTAGTGVHLQKLDARGQPVWRSPQHAPLDLRIAAPHCHYRLADLQAAGDGSVIVSLVGERAASGARHLYANKVSADGQLLWGAEHIKIFDGGSLQRGSFPHFVPDRRGGAVFAWYSVAPQLQVHAQHILSDGKAAFAHNGVSASTDLRQARTEPSIAYQPATGEITLFWMELDSASAQRSQGLYAQKIDARGARQWGESGRQLRAGPASITFLRSHAVADGTLAYWIETAAGAATDSIQAIKLDALGYPLCAPFAVSTRASIKSRLVLGVTGASQALLAWEDQVDGALPRIYLQSVRSDCRLG